MRIYVAGKLEEAVRVNSWVNDLLKWGYNITYDWTVDAKPPKGTPFEEATYKYICGQKCLRGAAQADVLLLLGHPNLKGALVEFGAAMAMGARCIVVDREKCENVFFNCDHVKHMTEDEARSYLKVLIDMEG